jgi:uncharacterized membrane protein YfcA
MPLLDAVPAATAAVALIIGFLIGSVGIGGVLLAPWLIEFGGLDVRSAITIAMASYVATGLAALVLHRNAQRSARRDGAHDEVAYRHGGDWRVIVATAPGALLGALALAHVPPRWPLALLAALLLATALRILLRAPATGQPRRTASAAADWATGAVAGFASALSGTGGPMVLVPLQAWRGVPLLAAIATGQLAQLPIALVATAGNAASGGVNLGYAALIGALLLPGVWVGPRVAHALPRAGFTRAVAVLLLATGAWLAVKVIAGSA